MHAHPHYDKSHHFLEDRHACSKCGLVDVCFPLGFDETERDHIRQAILKLGPYKRGESIFHSGDKFFAIYAVRNGSVKTVINEVSGRERVLSFHFKGEVFGFESIASSYHMSDCIALEDSNLCAFRFDHLRHFAERRPELYAEIVRLMSIELRRQANISPAFGAKERVAWFLLSLNNRLQKVGSFGENEIFTSMSRQDIAHFLPMAPETLSRILNDFEACGIIRSRGRYFHILKRHRLESLLQ